MCPNPKETLDLVKFAEEIFSGKTHFWAVLFPAETTVRDYHYHKSPTSHEHDLNVTTISVQALFNAVVQ